MKSKIIFVVLFMLSFNTFHDYFMTLMDKNDQTTIVQFDNKVSPVSESADFEKIHSMFHFMAIMTPYPPIQIQFAKKETIVHSLLQYTPPYKRTSYKPPTV